MGRAAMKASLEGKSVKALKHHKHQQHKHQHKHRQQPNGDSTSGGGGGISATAPTTLTTGAASRPNSSSGFTAFAPKQRTASTLSSANIMMSMRRGNGDDGGQEAAANTTTAAPAPVSAAVDAGADAAAGKARRDSASVFAEASGPPLSHEARIRARARNIQQLRQQHGTNRRVSFREDEDPGSFFNAPAVKCLRATMSTADRARMRQQRHSEKTHAAALINGFWHDWQAVQDVRIAAVVNQGSGRVQEVLAQLQVDKPEADVTEIDELERQIQAASDALDAIQETYRAQQRQVWPFFFCLLLLLFFHSQKKKGKIV